MAVEYKVSLADLGADEGALERLRRTGLDAAEARFAASHRDTPTVRLDKRMDHVDQFAQGAVTVVRHAPSLSVVSKSDVQTVFGILAKNPLAHKVRTAGGGCESRAYRMARLMDDMGLTSGKAFVSGKVVVNFTDYANHVAPVLMVDDQGTAVPYVLDPTVFDWAVPLSEWFSKIRSLSYQGYYFLALTNRYVYTPGDAELELKDYRLQDRIKVDLRLAALRAGGGLQSVPDRLRRLFLIPTSGR